MRYIFLFLMLQSTFLLKAQNRFEEVDKRVNSIPAEHSKSIEKLADWFSSNFEKEEDRYRAIFFWVANNLVYDIKSLSQPPVEVPKPMIVKKAFEQRKAVCEGYSGLMDSLCVLSGIRTVAVSGYTRNNGLLDITPHMWMAAYIDGEWTLSDPTWASGAIMDKRFVKQFEEKYFMTPPQKMIQSHIPYDPIWQLIKNTVTHKAFITNTSENKRAIEFNYTDSIEQHLNAGKAEQYQSELRRIQDENFNHQALQQRIQYLEGTINVIKHNETVAKMRQVTDVFNRAVELFNASVELYNKRAEAKIVNLKLYEAKETLSKAQEMLFAIENPPAALVQNKATMVNAVGQLEQNIQNFLAR
jgi:hypothetical protein